jgi:aminomethyltransferase
MPRPSPFHPVTSRLCLSQEWREWSGYLAAVSYQHTHEREYFAIRNSAALIDVSPLFKYEVRGPQAARLVDRIVTRDVAKARVGQILYTPWCDDDGKVIDDGTVWKLAPDRFRITAADPSLRWFEDCGFGLEAEIEDRSDQIAAVALQGPRSREILLRSAGGEGLEALRYYHLTEAELGGAPATITRTGYTGDLGYEIWIDPADAASVWNRLMAAGADYGLLPAGLAALDLARLEAGLLLIEVDYISSLRALSERRKSSPFELGLDWTVALDGTEFVGRRALQAEAMVGPAWALVGLAVEWSELDRLFGRHNLPPMVAGRASRLAVPVYRRGRQIGQATSLGFSPLLKKYIALASLERRHAAIGSVVELEMTVEYQRGRVPARIVPKPFYDPPHKRQVFRPEPLVADRA